MTERLNVRRMQGFEDSRTRPFNVERDVTARDWQSMRGAMKYAEDHHNIKDIVDAAGYMSILKPGLQFRPGLSPDHVTTMTEYMLRQNLNILEFAKTAASLKIGNANAPTIDISLLERTMMNLFSENKWGEWRNAMGNYRAHDNWAEALESAAFLSIFAPEDMLRKYNLFIREKDLPSIQKNVQELRAKTDHNLIRCLAGLKVLNLPHAIEEQDWEVGRDHLKHLREEELWIPFALYAAEMKILAAGNVSVTEKGLELSPNRDFKEHFSSPPEILQV